jgi:hypothetical protein
LQNERLNTLLFSANFVRVIKGQEGKLVAVGKSENRTKTWSELFKGKYDMGNLGIDGGGG